MQSRLGEQQISEIGQHMSPTKDALGNVKMFACSTELLLLQIESAQNHVTRSKILLPATAIARFKSGFGDGSRLINVTNLGQKVSMFHFPHASKLERVVVRCL